MDCLVGGACLKDVVFKTKHHLNTEFKMHIQEVRLYVEHVGS